MDVLLIINIVVSFSLILGGYYMKYQAPKDKDMKMGVLIGRARLSPDIWKYANITCGKNWLVTGFIYLVLGMPVILLMYNFKGENAANRNGGAASVQEAPTAEAIDVLGGEE